jgi:hypothetical protein
MSDFQQTVDLRGKMERQRKAAMIKKPVTPLEKIYNEEKSTEAKTDLKKISQPKIKNSHQGLIKAVVFVLAVLIIIAAFYFLFFKNKNWFSGADKNQTWYAVTLKDNGLVYYGQVSDVNADPVVINNVYYDYDQKESIKNNKIFTSTGDMRLVKQGKETYGPESKVLIYQCNISDATPLKSDSKVLQAILEYEK